MYNLHTHINCPRQNKLGYTIVQKSIYDVIYPEQVVQQHKQNSSVTAIGNRYLRAHTWPTAFFTGKI